ncbi:BQ5605_C008g05252 [Microbotryum silenes-dioicae]|uniref:BQ5605_C008g05252 protein n=1 Tax=Microbotryum silenes-dioicae TaxID=796604 RepID=A0A2X0MFY3_9BASI|nr:BQ5605_C008g05252 [Microbotryum silenes-dioicae]
MSASKSSARGEITYPASCAWQVSNHSLALPQSCLSLPLEINFFKNLANSPAVPAGFSCTNRCAPSALAYVACGIARIVSAIDSSSRTEHPSSGHMKWTGSMVGMRGKRPPHLRELTPQGSP